MRLMRPGSVITTVFGMTLAEDYLLLVTNPDGKPLDSYSLDIGVAGACLCVLEEQGRIGLDEKGRIQTSDPSPTGDPLLDLVLKDFAERAGKKPDAVLPAVGKDLPPAIYERLRDQGRVTREEAKTLGLFNRIDWPPVPGAGREHLVAELAQVLSGEVRPDERTGALIALLAASGLAHTVLGEPSGLSRKEAKSRAKAIAEGDWASAAVSKAITDAQTAIMAAIMVVTIGGASFA